MLTQLKSLLQSKSAQSVGFRKEGDAHLRASRMGEAEKAYQRALAADAQNCEACIGLGYVFNDRKDYASSKEMLRRALAIDAANADAHYMLGTIAVAEKDVPAAVQGFNRAIECRPDFEFAHRALFSLLAETGDMRQAQDVIERAAVACPNDSGIHYTRGKLFAAQGDFAAAAACFGKAVSLEPGTAEFHKSLADALKKSGQPEQAVASLQKAVWFDHDYFEGHLELGDLMRRRERHGEAVTHYREAIRLQPDTARAHINLGVVLQAQNKVDEAMASYRRALEIEPRNTLAHSNLGSALMIKGDKEAAIGCLERVLAIDPEHNAKHLLAALKGGDSERAPSGYVEKLFDWYADSFDAHLVKGLNYSVPEKLRDLLQPHASSGGEKWTILDLGCGTGLAGVAMAPFARSIVGVDLSSKMLDKARLTACYDRLVQLDLLAMLQAEAPSSYDVLIAADVFVYLGRLDELAAEAHRLLRAGGLFAFSVESLDALAGESAPDSAEKDYRLNETGRFAHSAAYLARLCEDCGFTKLSTMTTQSRVNDGKGVEGYLVVWKKSSDT